MVANASIEMSKTRNVQFESAQEIKRPNPTTFSFRHNDSAQIQ